MAARRDSKGSGKRAADSRSGNGSGGAPPSAATGKGFAAEPGSASDGVSPSNASGLSKAFGAPSLKRPASASKSSSGVGASPSAKISTQDRKKPNRQANGKVIPDAVAQRMARRIAFATGIPSLMGMGVFVGSYVLITRGIADIPTGVTLIASGGCFLLGLLGLSYGVLSASWEEQPGSLLGTEQIGVNITRLRQSTRHAAGEPVAATGQLSLGSGDHNTWAACPQSCNNEAACWSNVTSTSAPSRDPLKAITPSAKSPPAASNLKPSSTAGRSTTTVRD